MYRGWKKLKLGDGATCWMLACALFSLRHSFIHVKTCIYAIHYHICQISPSIQVVIHYLEVKWHMSRFKCDHLFICSVYFVAWEKPVSIASNQTEKINCDQSYLFPVWSCESSRYGRFGLSAVKYKWSCAWHRFSQWVQRVSRKISVLCFPRELLS